MADIITAEERFNWKVLVAKNESETLNADESNIVAVALRRTLAALEAAEAEIERLYVLCDWWAKEEGLQRQRAEKAEAENARLRELCGESQVFVEMTIQTYEIMGKPIPQSLRDFIARLRAAAEGKGTGT